MDISCSLFKKKTEDVSLKAISAETYGKSELIYISFNKNLENLPVSPTGFSCTVNSNAVTISSLSLNAANSSQIIISLAEPIFDIDTIKLNYSGTLVAATDGTLLTTFSNLQVKNNLPVYTLIPGKIEAESFEMNQGLVLETCTDTGGGQDLGYTSTGDYLEYKVRVVKTSKYDLEVRVASAGTAGKIEVQQINSSGANVNWVTLNTPVTGGWQTWQTISATIVLTEGIWTLRVKILQPEFNLNWFRFTENTIGIQEDARSVFTVFPNPANDVVSILIPGSTGQKKTVTLKSSNGSVVETVEVADSEVTKKLFVGNIPKGFYIVELEMSGKIFRSKLILN